MIDIGEIQRLSLSDIWKHEEHDFTPWLCNNIDKLSEVVGISISNPVKEKATDNFRVDIVATKDDEEEQKVIIENQYGASNHDHLGKLLSYASSFDAKAAIWIVEQARNEHTMAINKLNQYGANDCWYYLVEASAIRIDDSKPAISFTVIAAPDPEITTKALPESKILIKTFWTAFLKRCTEKKLSLYNRVNATTDHWINAGSGKNGIHYSIIATQSTIRVNLVMDKNEEWNRHVFNSFKSNKEQIETVFGNELDWSCIEGRKSCIIFKECNSGGYRSEKKQWPVIMDEAIDTVRRFENAFKPLIQKI